MRRNQYLIAIAIFFHVSFNIVWQGRNLPVLQSVAYGNSNQKIFFFNSSENEADADFWIVPWIEKVRFKKNKTPNQKCMSILEKLEERLAITNRPPPLLVVIDIGDSPSFHKFGCPKKIASMIGKSNLKLAVRGIVQKRNFGCMHMKSPTCLDQNFTSLYGFPWDYSHEPFSRWIHNGCIAKADFPVRDDLVVAMEGFLKSKNISFYDDDQIDSELRSKRFDTFWNIEPNDRYGQLRNRVTQSLSKMNISSIGLVSSRGRRGRKSVNLNYVKGLLANKIIVVAQRDNWEGHYRLFEALVGGALVMSDPIIHKPAGLIDKENIVIYNSLSDLKEKVVYYLRSENERKQIARAGKQVALFFHREKDISGANGQKIVVRLSYPYYQLETTNE